ncbi:glycosyltransferase family 2 protein [Pseudomonadota bacterium]
MRISIVIPVYKSTSTLVELADRIDRVFSELDSWTYEIIFVNDSPFAVETCKTLESLAAGNQRVTVIELMKNFGQQPATLCGIEHAKGDYVVTMDDDLQHAPEDIPKFLEKSSHDAVIARFRLKKHSLFKRMVSRIKGYFDYIILHKPRSLALSPFRMIKGSVARLMVMRNTPYPFIPALLFEITDDVVNVDAHHFPRKAGSTNYTFRKMLQVFSNLLINNSSLMLRLVGYLGSLIALIAFVAAVTIVVRKFALGFVVPGWPSTIVTILFFGGMILFTLGIVGEYLIRLIATTENRPTYYVRRIDRKEAE